jgi:hypothetical protein
MSIPKRIEILFWLNGKAGQEETLIGLTGKVGGKLTVYKRWKMTIYFKETQKVAVDRRSGLK